MCALHIEVPSFTEKKRGPPNQHPKFMSKVEKDFRDDIFEDVQAALKKNFLQGNLNLTNNFCYLQGVS